MSLVVVRDTLQLGMPHLGPHALGESFTLKHLGHLRWQAFERLTGVPIHRAIDGQGRRLYATFYHIDIRFPLAASPHAYREGDRVTWIGGLAAFGRNILDGYFALVRSNDDRAQTWGAPDHTSCERFLGAGIPVVRLCNIFIAQELGPDVLKVGQPVNADLSAIAGLDEAPDSYAKNRAARETGRFFDPAPEARPVPSVTAVFEHPIDPDRDVNAASLIYFGTFPAFFDLAERRALAALPRGGPPRRFVDRRATRRRLIGLYGNARSDDRLVMHAECAIVPEPVSAGPSDTYGRVWSAVRCHRASDGRLVAITTAERITPLADRADLADWGAYARAVT